MTDLNPFALSLSKCLRPLRQGFDKLSPNGNASCHGIGKAQQAAVAAADGADHAAHVHRCRAEHERVERVVGEHDDGLVRRQLQIEQRLRRGADLRGVVEEGHDAIVNPRTQKKLSRFRGLPRQT
jgi:hypothetical protein